MALAGLVVALAACSGTSGPEVVSGGAATPIAACWMGTVQPTNSVNRVVSIAHLLRGKSGRRGGSAGFGTSIPDVAKTLIEEGIRQAIKDGFLKHRPPPGQTNQLLTE